MRLYKKKVKSLDKELQILKSEKETLSIKKTKKKSKKAQSDTEDNSYKVDYMEALYLSERYIDSKYMYPIKDLEDKSNFFYAKKVVITGVYDDYPDRNDLAKLFWECGADIDRGIGVKTEFLIVGDEAGPKKLLQAKEQGITIIDQKKLNKYF